MKNLIKSVIIWANNSILFEREMLTFLGITFVICGIIGGCATMSVIAGFLIGLICTLAGVFLFGCVVFMVYTCCAIGTAWQRLVRWAEQNR